MIEVQRIILPGLEFGAPNSLYVRLLDSEVYLDRNERKVVFKSFAKVTFDTFFNSISIGRWREACDLPSLSLEICGKGEFLIEFCCNRIGHAPRLLAQHVIKLDTEKAVRVPMEFWRDLEDGMLFFRMRSFGEGEITSASYVTDAAPPHDVKLGIVVTHFNRKNYVVPAVKRVVNGLLKDPACKGKFELIIVDNSQNLTADETAGAVVIANPNLGGSGGFARGLMHLEDAGGFTHCLFMDDDASCEIESIRRAWVLLSYAKKERMAVAGSMLRETDKHFLFEKAATFDDWSVPLKHGKDMKKVGDLLNAELDEVKPDYGGWWFFAFKLSDVKHYPFPFFVRGDDITFGLMNDFNIVTMNGISVWGDDFTLKSNHVNRYLDARHYLLLQSAWLKHPCKKVIRKMEEFFYSSVQSYNYASADAVSLVIEHYLQGGDFWRKNYDLVQVRQQLASFGTDGKLIPIDRKNYSFTYYSGKNHSWHQRFFRWLTRDGLYIPLWTFRDAMMFQHKGYSGSGREIFRHKAVLYEYEPLRLGYVAHIDQKRARAQIRAFKRNIRKLKKQFEGLRADHRNTVYELTKRSFWEGVFEKGKS